MYLHPVKKLVKSYVLFQQHGPQKTEMLNENIYDTSI